MKILIIDDDMDDTLILGEALNHVWPQATLKISSTHGSWKSEIQTKETAPNIIFVDAFTLSGKDCLTQLNSLDNSHNIKIIVYTDENRPLEIDEFMQLGADQILLKTGNYNELTLSLVVLRQEYMECTDCRQTHKKPAIT